MRPADLQLDLDAYAGPFDLLCSVLLRRELDIGEVRLAEIVVGYVQQLAMRDALEPESASEFLVLIAALMEVKARELLAVDDDLLIEEPTAALAGEELLARMIQYSAFKNAAGWLAGRTAVPRYWRVASRPVIRKKQTFTGPTLDPALLRRALEILLAQPDVDVRHLVGKHASVRDMTDRLLGMLRERGEVRFEELVVDLSRLDQAVAFVATLELAKNGHIAISQTEPFASLVIAPPTVVASVTVGDGTGTDDDPATERATDGEEIQIA